MSSQWNTYILPINITSFDPMAELRLHPLQLENALSGLQIISFLGIILASYIIYERCFSPLAKVPGPFLACFTNFWWLRTVLKRQQHLDSLELHKKYGPLVRVGPNHIMVADLEAFKTIYGAGNKFSKSDFYRPFKAKLKWSLTAECDDRIHSKNRRLVSKAYSMDSVKTLEVFVDQVIDHFLGRMEELTGKPVDIGEWLQLFAIDSITEITFSKSFGYLDKGDEDGILSLSKTVFSSAAWVGCVPWVYWIHHVVSPITGNWLGVTMRSVRFRALASEKAKEHQSNDEKHKDVLGYLESVHQKKPDEYSEYDMVSTVTSNIFAGSDTTAISLRAMIYYLLSNPQYHDRFLYELRERREAGQISNPIRFEEAEAWPFLQAVMYEAIRLHPPFAVHLPRVVPEGGLTANGVYLPQGTVVGSNAWVIHRSKDAFGDDVDAFRPERWLDPEKKGVMQRYFFGFGGGARTCLGRNIVWLEMSKFLPTFFMHYDLKLVNPNKPMPVKNIFLAFQDGPEVILRKRESPI
ncbi:cytochrome P450 family protein [Xylogone sp. PMI_703]|nr:cytochrome P450 family protein [Xylogone sp. PMI_703]